MKRIFALGAILGAAILAACSATTGTTSADGTTTVATSANAVTSDVFRYGCAAVSYADGAFKAASPALVSSGKLTQDDVTKEASIFATSQATCANPPADPAAAATALVGQASAIYLLLAPKAS